MILSVFLFKIPKKIFFLIMRLTERAVKVYFKTFSRLRCHREIALPLAKVYIEDI